MRTREEEYLRRMKALGYEPSLAGTDDGDIEWELAKMEQSRTEPANSQLNKSYRPVDHGLKARILRQMGQPYDESAINPQESFYIGGWDNGGDEEEVKPLVPPVGGRRPDEPYDPWANTRKLDWGKDGNVFWGPRTIEYRPGRDGANLPSRGAMITPLGYASGGNDVGTGGQRTSAADNPYAGGYADGGAYGDMLLPGDSPQTVAKDAGGMAYPDLTDEQKLFLATVAGEAGGNSESAQRAVAHVIMNRVGYKGYEGRKTVGEVLTPDQFESIDKQNVPFQRMTGYLRNRDGSDPEMERIINAAMNVYHRKEPDFTGGAVLFYSPERDEEPPWPDRHKLQKLAVPVKENDNFWFYKYK